MLYFAMTHLSGRDRSQLLPLPKAADDYVGPDNTVRFIEAVVDEGGFEKSNGNGSLVGQVRWPLERVEPSAGLSKEERSADD